MENIFEHINDILSDWVPINVGGNLAKDKYQKYIPTIVKRLKNKNDLISYLEHILTDELDTGYDKNNDKHKQELDRIIQEMLSSQKQFYLQMV